MRRVVLTPTFAAGLGVVVAAMLAYPMRTVFLYAPPNDATCKVVSCETNSEAGGLPASGPTHRLNTSGSAGPHTGGKGARSRAGHAPGGGSTLGASPQLSYQTASKARWGFDGTIVITFKPKFAHQRWRLRFSYPAARILRVWTGSYLYVRSDGPHTAVVASLASPGHGTFQRLVRVSIEVAGRPGPPRQCSFNGRSCHFGGRHAGQGGSTGGGGHKSAKGGGHKAQGRPRPQAGQRRQLVSRPAR